MTFVNLEYCSCVCIAYVTKFYKNHIVMIHFLIIPCTQWVLILPVSECMITRPRALDARAPVNMHV